MVVVGSRARLDQLLGNEDLTLLLLFGEDATAAAVHRKAVDEVENEWRKAVLIKDLTLPTAAETAAWSVADGNYAVLGTDRATPAVAEVATELLRQDGEPSVLLIRRAFAKGDQA